MEKYDGEAEPPQPSSYIRPQERKIHDPAVTFEEYHYYALKTRQEECNLPPATTTWREVILRKQPQDVANAASNEISDDGEKSELDTGRNLSIRDNRAVITDEEWTNASRAFRTATWGACFYLITTDVLGPYGVGFAMGTLGWGPGIVLYTVFGFMAGYSGYLLWHTFLGLDSYEFPLKNYGDLAFRVYGTSARYLTNILQVLALLFILGQVTIQFGQALSQVSKFKLCYAVCPVIFLAAGFVIGQIRTLRNYGWVASLAVWINLLVIFISMGVIAHTPPNYSISVLGSAGSATNPDSIKPNAQGVYPPVMHHNGLPSDGLVGSINGLLQGVFAYSGAQLFAEFMAEMRRPTDFLKAMWGAQCFIWIVYLSYGCFVYYYQGQYAYQISYQGVSSYAWQVVGDMLATLAGLIALGLYGNIGIKVLYNNVLVDFCNVPPLTSKPGKMLWVILVPIYYSIGYVIAAAIPSYFSFVSVISAATSLQFTYTFPPLLALGYDIQLQAMKAAAGNGFDPRTGVVTRDRSGISRWVRGFVSGGWLQIGLNVWHLIYALGALSLCGLGLYAAIQGMIEAFKIPQVNSFTCVSPLNLAAVNS